MKPIRIGLLAILALPLASVSCGGANDEGDTGQASEEVKRNHVVATMEQTNLVSDQPDVASRLSPHLVNAWGMAFNPGAGLVWISSTEEGLAQVYDSKGNHKLAVSVPVPRGQPRPSAPTGQLFNDDASAFDGDRFIFVTEGGTISGWQPSLGTKGAIRVDDTDEHNIYKGATIAKVDGKPRLYVTDFAHAKIEGYDASYQDLEVRFVDPDIPKGYAPFNMMAIDMGVLVTYAKQDANKEDDVKGAGNGYVSLFDDEGRFVQRLISRGALNSPWGLAMAPDKLGRLSNRLLVGNFGDGTIHAYELKKHDGQWRAELDGVIGKKGGGPLVIDRLWSIGFGPGTGGFGTDQLYFTAGPDDESHGLFGRLDLVSRQ